MRQVGLYKQSTIFAQQFACLRNNKAMDFYDVLHDGYRCEDLEASAMTSNPVLHTGYGGVGYIRPRVWATRLYTASF